MTERQIYCPLMDAPINRELVLVDVTGSKMRDWLRHLGLFKGSILFRHSEEVHYYPVRVRGSLGDVVVPAGFGIKTIVHLDDSDERRPLTEMSKKSSGHIETISGAPSLREALAKLGLVENGTIFFIHTLPHMDYVTIINHRYRTRLTEGEAAKIWGEYVGREGRSEGQFYFSRKGEEFLVRSILGGARLEEHLASHGVRTGDRLYMETVEQVQELHKPTASPVVISSPGGLRLYLAPGQAERITVKTV